MPFRIFSILIFFTLASHSLLASDCGDAFDPVSIRLWTGAQPVEATRTQKDPITRHLIETYFRLVLAANGKQRMPRFLQPQSLFYILDTLNLDEQARLSTLMEHASSALEKAKSGTAAGALNAGGDPGIIAKIMQLDEKVTSLKKKHKSAVKLALENHDDKGQLYGDKPYSTHLRSVREVLKRFGFGPKDSVLGLRLGTDAWLHDIVEDTGVTRSVIAAALSEDDAEIVTNLTNEPDRPGVSKEEQKRITFERVASRLESRILKLADRITNVEESLINFFLGKPTKIEKYFREWPAFKKYIYRHGEAIEMWEHLERLLTDPDYARRFALSRATQ